jgi:hypothetical protein
MQIALKHREEVKELLGKHEDIVWSPQQDMEVVAKPMVTVICD